LCDDFASRATTGKLRLWPFMMPFLSPARELHEWLLARL
jgi:hypothetical protein